VRQLLSKSIAGGLSAGVVLLWWPVLFADVDSVSSWFVRGVAWTVLFELLLFALIPFERALWETSRGERIQGKVGAAGSRLHSGTRRERIGRLSALATVALAVPVTLLVMGIQEHSTETAEAKVVRPVKVVRVTKVVKRVVERAPISGQPIAQSEQAAPVAAPAPAPSTQSPDDPPVVGRTAPVQRQTAPKATPEPAPEDDVYPAPAPSF
jgi:hypothetical protein